MVTAGAMAKAAARPRSRGRARLGSADRLAAAGRLQRLDSRSSVRGLSCAERRAGGVLHVEDVERLGRAAR